MTIILLLVLNIFYLLTKNVSLVPLQFNMAGSYNFYYQGVYIIFSYFKILLGSVPVIDILILFFISVALLPKNILIKINNFYSRYNQNQRFWYYGSIIIIVIAFIEYCLTNYFFLEAIPHVGDAIAYSTQAKIFAAGRLYLTNIPFPEHFPLLGMISNHGKIFSQYTFGHPLILSLGYLINLPWIIPPIIGTLSLILIYKITSQLYSQRVAFITVFLSFMSPFIKMNSVNFMSHNTALLFILLSVFLFIKMTRFKKNKYAFFVGLTLGFVINIRPYTGILVLIPFLIYPIFQSLLKDKKLFVKILRLYIFLFLGLAIMLFLYCAYNYLLTGHPFKTPYSLGYVSPFGFSTNRRIEHGLYDVYTNLSLLNKSLLGWPQYLTFLFLIIYILTPVLKKWECFFCVIIVMIIAGYFFYQGSWMMYGSRFWYELTPFLIIIIVAGIEKMPMLILQIIPDKYKHHYRIKRKIILSIVYIFIFLLTIYSANGWYIARSNQTLRWRFDFTPENIGELKGFNYAKRDLVREVKNQNIHRAIVFIRPTKDWWTYGIASYFLNLKFNDDIIYALDLGDEKNIRLIRLYPNRSYYKGDYDNKTITKYDLYSL